MGFNPNKLALVAISMLLPLCVSMKAEAQDASTAAAVTASAPQTTSERHKASRAQRKAARKAARAKNSVELKRLEDSGYKPALNDPNYPQNLQNAEKKAAGGAGASQ
jgi:hypothetical protein